MTKWCEASGVERMSSQLKAILRFSKRGGAMLLGVRMEATPTFSAIFDATVKHSDQTIARCDCAMRSATNPLSCLASLRESACCSDTPSRAVQSSANAWRGCAGYYRRCVVKFLRKTSFQKVVLRHPCDGAPMPFS